DDGGLDLDAADPSRVAVVVGTTSGEPHVIEALDGAVMAGRGDSVDRRFVHQYPSHIIPAHGAAELRVRGQALTAPPACPAGNAALAYGCRAIRSGAVDVVLAGGADAFSRITYTGFARLGAVAPHRCQPFSRDRKGIIPGEGAGILLLESADDAAARGARVYAEITGYGLACDAHHMTSGHPAGDGAVRAMQLALDRAHLPPEAISYVS